MQHQRVVSNEDWNDLLNRLARRGVPEALEDQLSEAKPKPGPQRPGAAFHLNQGLFDASQN
ncbi:MAG: hypothetical protein ACR2JJ_06700 [Sphingomicrobium sp.]